MNEEPERAVAYFQKAVDAGNLEAMISLGCYYTDGVVVEQDYDEAFKWFKRAAEDETIQVDCIIWHVAIESAWVQRRTRQRLTALADEMEQDDCLVSEVEDTEK